MDAPELKPCPFCGSKNIGWDWREAYSLDSSYAFFGCQDCSAGFDNASENDTAHPEDISAWNRRADLARPKVKALVWVTGRHWSKDDDNGPLEGVPHLLDAWRAESYVVIRQRGKDGLYILRGMHFGPSVFPTLEAAKAAAQADYERRILAALEE